MLLRLSPPASTLLLLSPHHSIKLHQPWLHSRAIRKLQHKGGHGGVICRAELSQDAPFALAIEACILNSLIFPVPKSEPNEQGSGLDSSDTRFAAMGIISFIPYFNWMSWIFAWLDTGRQRYLVYSIVYLVPYLRTNLSLSPEESWLPIASILFCIVHIQLEANISNGDLQSFQLFGEALQQLKAVIGKKDAHYHHSPQRKGESKKKHEKLPSKQEKTIDEFRDWVGKRETFDDKIFIEKDDVTEAEDHHDSDEHA
ncbi:hypothetical protein AMTRI_Chr09g19510 [Amborella trichopoda]